MSRRNLFASTLTACVLAVGFPGIAPVVNAASPGQFILKSGESARTNVIKIKLRSRGPRIYLPISPSYLAYDYPYYYSRGFYPTHIGPGYVYYGYPYNYRSSYYPEYSGRCSYRNRRCVANWEYHRGLGSSRRQRARSFGACRCP